MMIRASPMACSRRLRSRSRQRSSSRRIGAGVEAGSRVQSMSARSTSAIVCDVVSPSKRRRPASISNSTTPNAQMSERLSTGEPLACSGLM